MGFFELSAGAEDAGGIFPNRLRVALMKGVTVAKEPGNKHI